MLNIPGNVEWVADLIPGLEGQLSQFVVATDEVDDELVEVFIEELVRLSQELRQGVDSDDMEMVRSAAHSIKGMGGTIGLPEISVLGLTIENAAKQNRMDEVRPLVSALANWVSTLS